MKIALWNWHTPYLFLLVRALPGYEFLALPTLYNPSGWDEQQRPLPENVTLSDARVDVELFTEADVVLLQNGSDLRRFFWDSDLRVFNHLPVIYVAHNRIEFDFPTGPWIEWQPGHIRVVAISEMKAQSWRIAGYVHPITVIPPYVSLDDYGGWRGDGDFVLTVANGLARPLFDLAVWRQATEGLPVRLVGSGNDGIPGAVGPATSWEALKEEYRRARVYLSVNKWPEEDGYNLAWLEAAATGCPMVTLANPTAPLVGYRAGLVEGLQTLLRYCLDGHDGKRQVKERRRSVAEGFPLAAFQERWRAVLEKVVR